MDDLVRAMRRLSGRYVPYLEPYWDRDDFTGVDTWLKSGVIADARPRLIGLLKSRFPQSEDVVLTDSGKTAIWVVLKMRGLAPGDEVIVPSYCCASVLASVLRAGCAPVLVDSDDQFNISEKSVLAALSPRIKAILVPHLFGLKAAALEAIVDLGRKRGIPVIEDVAQAYGLKLESGALAGTLGDAAIFSAGLGKPLMGPGGGWAIVNRRMAGAPALETEPAEEGRARVSEFLRRFTGAHWRRGGAEIAHALPARFAVRKRQLPNFDLTTWAETECRLRAMSPIDAWLAARQIERIESNIDLRQANAARWRKLLAAAKIPCVTPPDAANIHTIFPLLFDGKDAVRTAATVRHALEQGGVATEPCYTPLHLRVEGKTMKRTDMAVCESFWQRMFAVTCRPNLSPGDWRRIESAVARAGAAVARA